MTEFVVDGAMPLATIKSTLEGWQLGPESSARLRRSYYDTPDARLFGEGLRLVHELAREGGQLKLIRLPAMRVEATLPVDLVPMFVDDLPDSSVRRLLSPLVEMRALVQRAVFDVQSDLYLLRNPDQKELVRMRVERSALLTTSRKIKQPLLVVVESLRGYPAEARKLQAASREAGWQPAAGDGFTRALALLKEEAAVVQSTQLAQIGPELRADEAIKQLLLQLLDTMAANEPGIRARTDTEFLHDYRVALRKSRSLLGQAKGVLPETTRRRWAAFLKVCGTETGAARDMDVYLLQLPKFQERLPKAMKSALTPFRLFLERHRDAEYARLTKFLDSADTRRRMAGYRRFLLAPVPARPRLPLAAAQVRSYALERIARLYAKLLAQGREMDATTPDEEIHRLRIRCKKLRYLLEFFQLALDDPPLVRMQKRVKALQQVLGRYQDCVVQQARLVQFETDMERETGLERATREALEWLIRKLAAQQHQVRAEFDRYFATFATPKMKRRMDQLTKAIVE